MFMLWSSMTRVSPTGVVSGASERVDAYAALQALTTGPAWQAFEEDRKGRIKSGLLADFVILDRNPLTTRSEEHTSELQSLMRISYAVFCLKKKNNNNKT